MSLTLVLAVAGTVLAQPEDLQVQGNYTHAATRVDFPEKVEQYRRINVRAYNKEQTDVGASYEWFNDQKQTLVTVYVFPAYDGREGRLRRHYLSAMNDMRGTAGDALGPVHTPRLYYWEQYRLNGFSATLVGAKASRVTVFECGQWFFKIRSTTALLDSAELSTLESRFLDAFQPARMVRDFPLNVKGEIVMAVESLRDSLMMNCTIQSATQKMRWAQTKVDSLERLSGFPDLYLELHVTSFRKFAETASSSKAKGKSRTTKYVKELNQLIDAGFLEEFVVEYCSGVIIVPADTVLDIEGYQKWRKKNKSKSDIDHRFHVILYRKPT
jgi:hypothetical protein